MKVTKLRNKEIVGRTSTIMYKKRNPTTNLNEFGTIAAKKMFKNLNRFLRKEELIIEV